MSDSNVMSPCVAVCVLDERDICQGCYRSAEEITDWFMASDDRRRQILKHCDERRLDDNPIQLS